MMRRVISFAILIAASVCGEECRVTGIVISTKAETRAQPAENQFRLRVLDSPWGWQIGTSLPVTLGEPTLVAVGETVEVHCDFAKATRKGRFFGLTARRVTATRRRPS